MKILNLEIALYAPFVHTLKEKRSNIQGLLLKLRRRFNASALEGGDRDKTQTLTLRVAALTPDAAAADRLAEAIVHFIESNTDAEIIRIERETLLV